ncbi:Di-copper centre-containing protein [Durotheca rogersii]|uniref:Di-copper centre-containing protein n=1 Tax=Durotheca rogersii TaxID=419775 RepID=UPI00221F295B|nr:Di-copper centre-containing protein [Durotheca rogersii]KAI5863773.1 Di-copper centre-containing protein [Durotheca rogersii]
MRFSVASQVLCGAVAVSALSIPRSIEKRLKLIGLGQFGSFPTITPEEAHREAENILKDIILGDGPQFKHGQGGVGSSTKPSSASAVGNIAAADAGTCDPNNPAVRLEWRNYSPDDRKAFVDAIKCLIDKPSSGGFQGSQNRYEDIVSVHQQLTPSIHQSAVFLPWHRYYVSIFESLLREECGFDRALPWWDETLDAGNFAQSSIFTDEYFGPLPAKTSDGQGTCIESGTFGGLTLHVGPGSRFTDHCLARAADEGLTGVVTSQFVQDCNSRSTYDAMRSCQELGPHAYGHNGIGAVMSEVQASPGDPVFFLHHLFVDHGFRVWQNGDPSRSSTIDGCAGSSSPCTPVSMDTVLSSNGLRPDTTVGAVMDTLGDYLCYRYDY